MSAVLSGDSLRALTTAGLTDVGLVREENQDFLAEFESPSGVRLLVVADGMGGHQGGSEASRLCVETLGDVFRRSSEDAEPLLREAIAEANDRIHRTAASNLDLSGMGTTVVLLLLDGDRAWVAHVGDSRAYLMRDGSLRALTEDHTVVAALQKRGILTAEQAEKHPRKNELVRCVGFHQEASPEVTEVPVLPGDRFLLCSDGLSGQVAEDEIASVLAGESPTDAAKTLVRAANAAGGRDNVTVLIAAVPGGATTVVDRAAPFLPPAPPADTARSPIPAASPPTLAQVAARREEIARDRRRRLGAAWIAIVAGALAIGVLWLTLA